ncbi:hypothetical protein [Nocardiopsis lambiniae]|uniref:Uncharacterized protein n=1 Tax=Nocardiopsis lambiniae TaxID=3075539 RepID=A0ABU2MAX8_9ACTN|nr:hypothetical protein [Nocardiopsis sp. DSM 44743]MDT0329834.1 hypothetical protein [Nocardiopsis sp. DSM 44743]
MADRALFCALHGTMEPHPWYDPATADPYILFHARSHTRRWLAAPDDGRPEAGLWGMNDAGLDPLDEDSRRLWFQVSQQPLARPRRAVPAQQMLDCAGAVADRVGRLDLEAAQLLVPLQELPPGPHEGAYGDLVSALPWFAELPARARTAVTVSLDSGTGTEAADAAPAMVERLREIRQQVFTDITAAPGRDAARGLTPGIPDFPAVGAEGHRATFEGYLAEWSCEATGWLMALICEAAIEQGVRVPVVATIRLSPRPGG